jgi:hypothetical protein
MDRGNKRRKLRNYKREMNEKTAKKLKKTVMRERNGARGRKENEQ